MTRAAVIRDGIAVGIASGVYGVSFGAVSVGAGLSVLQTCVLSLLLFTGASQFALVGVIAGGGNPLAGVASALLLGTRNTLYGLRLSPILSWRGGRRALAAHLVIDESTAMSISRPTPELARTGFLATGLSVLVLWNLSTLVGAVAGTALGDPRRYGLDAAVGGAFLALLWPRLGTTGHRVVGLAAVTLALGLVPLSAAGVPVLAAAGVAVVGGLLGRGRPAEETQEAQA